MWVIRYWAGLPIALSARGWNEAQARFVLAAIQCVHPDAELVWREPGSERPVSV